jgi:diguanylate cyclase (GGDEF)-like protein
MPASSKSDADMRPASTGRDAASDPQKLVEQTHKLAQLNSWFEVALNNMARGLSMFDADRRLIVCNALYREIYELPDELTQPGTPFSKIIAYHAAKEGSANTAEELMRQHRWMEQHARELAHGRTFTHEQTIANGRIILVTIQPLADGGWVDTQEDITERTLAQERITWLAQHCPLTDLANRFHLREQLDVALCSLKPGSMLAVHLIDLDRFKPVNDTFGHAAGDAVLKAVARRVRAAVRDHDIVGRIGGDEFAVVQTDIVGPEQATSLALRLVKTLNAPYRVLGANVELGASVGVAIAPEQGHDADTLLRRADVALYRVKSSGRGAFSVYRPEDSHRPHERIEIEEELSRALIRQQIDLYYQPIVDVKAGAVTGCEALMRWRHPRLGMVPPSTFIPIAESSGLMLDLGAWAMRRACADAASWSSKIKIAVNLSPVQFDEGDPAVLVEDTLKATGLEPERLEIEITESALLRCEARTIEILGKLKALGVGLVLDDFGTGFASLSYLRNFSFDKIKIDRSFVSEMTERRDCVAIVGAVAGLARTLGIGPVAEGVEGMDQIKGVSIAGCDEMQGFYFSRPVPASELDEAVGSCLAKLALVAETAAGVLPPD